MFTCTLRAASSYVRDNKSHVCVHQVSQNSSVASVSASMRVVRVPFLPRRPEVLLRWVLQRHTSISSLTHIIHANRVSLSLGEGEKHTHTHDQTRFQSDLSFIPSLAPTDPSMPSECRLRPLFMSQNYQASELQEQEVHGCVSSSQAADAELHIIRLMSSGSTLCG